MGVYVWHDGRNALTPWLNKLTVAHGAAVESLSGVQWIVHWCGEDRSLKSMKSIVLNYSSYTRRIDNQNKIREILRLHGISYMPLERRLNSLLVKQNEPHYLIPVFLMEALATFRLDNDHPLSLKQDHMDSHNLQLIPMEHKNVALRRLERYAVRAVYAMGLDYACVYAQVHRSGHAVITRIDVDPIQGEEVNDLFAQAINNYGCKLASNKLEQKPVLYGMDPEFLLRNTAGKIVPASRYLSSKGGVGYDSATVLGRKHIHPLAELRPEPSENVTALVNNLRRTMWVAASQITDYSLQWIAGGMPVRGLPLGGHLHMSGILLHTPFIRCMDNYLALPLIMIEDSSTRGRRSKYGRLGDVRRPAHGGFEYRTLPSWIVSPVVTKGVLALTQLIVQHYDELTDRPLDRVELLTAYMDGDKLLLEPVVRDLWAQIEATKGYAEHRMYLEPLKNSIMQRRIWNEQLDFRMSWRIPPFHS